MLGRRGLLLSGLCCWAGVAAAAEATGRLRIRAVIDAINDKSLQATSRDGDKLSIALPADLSVTAIVRARITDIRSGSYIGTAAIPQPDGTLRALEVQVFPERMRGVGEGSHPYDLRPGSTMTNGAAGDVVGTQGRTLTLRYKGGEKRLVVPENAPIITYEPGTRAMLVPGAHVIVTAAKDAAGGLTATRVAVGRNGLTPPM